MPIGNDRIWIFCFADIRCRRVSSIEHRVSGIWFSVVPFIPYAIGRTVVGIE